MRLFIAIQLNDEMKDALVRMQNVPEADMIVDRISLMRSDRGKHGMIYTEL